MRARAANRICTRCSRPGKSPAPGVASLLDGRPVLSLAHLRLSLLADLTSVISPSSLFQTAANARLEEPVHEAQPLPRPHQPALGGTVQLRQRLFSGHWPAAAAITTATATAATTAAAVATAASCRIPAPTSTVWSEAAAGWAAPAEVRAERAMLGCALWFGRFPGPGGQLVIWATSLKLLWGNSSIFLQFFKHCKMRNQ